MLSSRRDQESDASEPAEEDEWDVCLSDFGLSAQKNRSELMTQLCGTPAFTGTDCGAPSPLERRLFPTNGPHTSPSFRRHLCAH